MDGDPSQFLSHVDKGGRLPSVRKWESPPDPLHALQAITHRLPGLETSSLQLQSSNSARREYWLLQGYAQTQEKSFRFSCRRSKYYLLQICQSLEMVLHPILGEHSDHILNFEDCKPGGWMLISWYSCSLEIYQLHFNFNLI